MNSQHFFGDNPKPSVLLERLVGAFPLLKEDEKILIVGAGGQIGHYLVPALKAIPQYRDRILLGEVGERAQQPGYTEVDITKPDQYLAAVKSNNVSVLINLAALLSGAAAARPELAYEVNLRGAQHTFDIAKRANVRHLMIPSSVAAFEANLSPVMDGEAETARKMDERQDMPVDAKFHTESSYGLTKAIIMSTAQLYILGIIMCGVTHRY